MVRGSAPVEKLSRSIEMPVQVTESDAPPAVQLSEVDNAFSSTSSPMDF